MRNANETDRFIGRRQELAEVRRLLATARLVTLTGIGGAGKTRLARRTAAESARTFRDGVFHVELADLTDPDLLVGTVADAVGVQVQREDDPGTLAAYLADRQALVVLDNCEHLLDTCATLVDALLVACPEVRVLATSRQPLGIVGESVLQVPPLSMPDPERPPGLQALAQYDAVGLFVERATAVLPSFQLTEENAEAVSRLCAALDGVPLAIELAAARIRVLSPEGMLQRLDDRYHLLSRGMRGVPERQRSLRASVEWSFELCTPQERALWMRMAVFSGGSELEGVEKVCSGDGLDEIDMLDLVDSLMEKSVLTRDEAVDGVVRYRMLETIRHYGLERLEETGELDHWRGRHLAWCQGLADELRTRWFGAEQVQLLAQARREHANVRAALELAAARPETAPAGLRILVGLHAYWPGEGWQSEARHWAERLLAHGTGRESDRALAMILASWYATMQVDLDAAEEMLDRARRTVVPTGGDRQDAISRSWLQAQEGFLAAWRMDARRGAAALERAIGLAEQTGDVGDQATFWMLLGWCRGYLLEHDAAAAAHQRCLELTEPVGERYWRSHALAGLAFLALLAGDHGTATELGRESVTLKHELGDRVGIALVFEALAWVAAEQGRTERGATLLGAADAVWRTAGTFLVGNRYVTGVRERGIAAVREALGERSYRAAFDRGGEMSLGEAVSFALEQVVEVRVPQDEAEPTPLTPREDEVAQLLGQGLSNREIAERLVVSQRTAQGHVENILRKLGFNSRAQVAAWVAERNARHTRSRRHLRAVGDGLHRR